MQMDKIGRAFDSPDPNKKPDEDLIRFFNM